MAGAGGGIPKGSDAAQHQAVGEHVVKALFFFVKAIMR